MKTKPPSLRISFIVLALLAILLTGWALVATLEPSSVRAQTADTNTDAAAPTGTQFTYQGRVTDADGAGINEPCQFIFGLYDVANGGSAIGSNSPNNVPLADGYFNVLLDFGANAFTGQERYLEIQVDCDGQGYTTLSPRQLLSATPYALHALEASSTDGIRGRTVAAAAPSNGEVLKWNGVQWAPAADNTGGSGSITGIDAGVGLLGGGNGGLIPLDVDFEGSGVAEKAARSDHDHDGVYAPSTHTHDERYYRENELQASGQAQVHWDNLTNVPPDLGTTYSAGPGLTVNNNTFSTDFGGSGSANQVAHSDHDHSGQYQAGYKRTIVVSPVGDGSDASANGAALLAAHNGIADADAANPYLLKIEPGIYDIGGTPLLMQRNVDVEGSGQGVTIIRRAGSNTAPGATVHTASFAEIRQLTIEAIGNGLVDYATGIYADDLNGTRIVDVHVTVKQARSLIVGIDSAASTVSLNRVSILVDALGENAANVIGLSISNSVGNVEDVAILTVGGNFNRGALILDASPTLRNLDIEVYSGVYPRGISIYNTSNFNSNGGVGKGPLILDSTIYSTNTGLYVSRSSPSLRNVNIDADTTAIDVILDDPGSVMKIDRSTIRGGSESINGASAYNFEIGASQLDGVKTSNNATFTCVNSYNGSYNSLGVTCQ